jgi:uncharacterized protein YqkB
VDRLPKVPTKGHSNTQEQRWPVGQKLPIANINVRVRCTIRRTFGTSAAQWGHFPTTQPSLGGWGVGDTSCSWVDSIKSPVTFQSHQNSYFQSLLTTLEIHWAICIGSSRSIHYFSCKLCSGVERLLKVPTKGLLNMQEQMWPGQKLPITNIDVGARWIMRRTFGTSAAQCGHCATTQPTFLLEEDTPWSWVDSIKSPVTFQSHQNSYFQSLMTTLEIHWARCIGSSRFIHYFSCKLCSGVERLLKVPTKGHWNMQERKWPGQKLPIANINVGARWIMRRTFGTSAAQWVHFPTTQPTFLLEEDTPWSWVDSMKSPVTFQSHQNSYFQSLVTTLEIHWAICIGSSRSIHCFSCKLCSGVERLLKVPTKGHSNMQEQRWPIG